MKHFLLLLISKNIKSSALLILFLAFSQTIFSQSDLSLSQVVDNSTAAIGSNLIFTITVNNEGSTNITNLQVKDTLPSGTSLVSATASIGVYNPVTGIWDIADNMTSSVGTATLTIEVKVIHDGLIYNLAEIIAMNEADVDSTPNNADFTEDDIASACSTVPIKLCLASSESYTLTAAAAIENYEWFRVFDNGGSLDTVSVGTNQTLVVNQIGDYFYTGDITGSTCSGGSCCPITFEDGCMDLSMTLSTTSTNVIAGDDVPFTVEVVNEGDIDARNIVVETTIPSGFTFVEADNPNWTLMPSGKIQSTVDTLNTSTTDSINLVLKVNVSAGEPNDLMVFSEIVASEDRNAENVLDIDSTEGNNSTTEDDDDSASVILLEFDLALTVIGDKTMAMVDDTVDFTIRIANQGVIMAHEVSVVGYVPTGYDFVAMDNAGWTDIGNGKVTTTITTLGVGADLALHLVLKVNASAGTNAGDLVFASEVMSAKNGNDLFVPDVDSTPDMDATNDLVIDRKGITDHVDIDYVEEDEDDMDIAIVTLIGCTEVSAGDDQIICQGSSVQLNAIGTGGTYAWTDSLGLSCSDCPNPMANPSITTNYIVTNTDGGCVTRDTVTITVIPEIQVTPNITARECCSAGAINLVVSGGSGTGFTYQWQDNISTSNEAIDLNAGTYEVTILDNDGTCSTVESFTVADNCSMTGCTPLFTETDTVTLQQGESYTTCMSIKLEDISNYEVKLDTQVYNDPITACNVDTLLYYSYAFVRGQGNDGPYDIDWMLDGVKKTARVQNIEELKDSMNIWDSMGDWTNSSSNFTLSGGDYKNVVYGDLNILHIGTNIPTNILVNTTTVAFGSEITVSPEPGLHQVVAMEQGTCCSDTLFILVEPNCDWTADVNVTNSGCCDNDGSATITVNGGQMPIDFNWGTLSATGNELVDMAAGTYSVTITDGYGCELIKEVVIAMDCDANACSGLITQDSVEVVAGEALDLCLNIKPQDYNTYNILLDGNAYTPPTSPCNLDSVLFYTYALVVGQGATGPYEVDWTVDGQIYNGTVGTMDELTASMNTWDPDGNWKNDTASFIITGGQDGVNYGDMHVKHMASSVTATIMRNITSVAFGTNIQTSIADAGTHQLIVQDPTSCCEDTVIITVIQGCTLNVELTATPTECCPSGSVVATVTGGVEPYIYEWANESSTTNEITDLGGGTYTITVTDKEGCSVSKSIIVTDNCDRSTCPNIASEENINAEVGENVELCLNIDLDSMNLYDIILDGSNYTPPLDPCNMDTVVFYTYALALNQGKNGPYNVDWVSHGVTYNAEVQDMFALATKMNEWDPNGNWVNNDSTLTISGGDSSNKYGRMDITHIETQTVANILTNFTGVGNGTKISVEMISGGEHELIVMNKTTCCSDTVHISVPLTPLLDTLYITTPYNANADTCMDMSQLAGNFSSIASCNDPANGTVEMGTDNCITYDPNQDFVGQDTFCVVICDDLSACDTTYVVMTVEPKVLCPDLLANEFVSIASDNCDGNTSFCLDLSMDDVANYTIYDNGELYTTNLRDCEVDTSGIYGYDEVNGLYTGDLSGINGFVIEGWMVNGEEVSSETKFYNKGQMLSVMRSLDPLGKWKLNAESFEFVSKNSPNAYGKMKVTNIRTDESYELSLQARYEGSGMELELSTGMHEVVVVDDVKGCSDTMTIAISCIKPNIMMDTVLVGEKKKMCLTSDDLVTTVTSTSNVCEEISGERVLFSLDTADCINYEGMEVGQESACLVFCDDYGLCDTTYVIVSVLEKVKQVNPVTVNDEEFTIKNKPVIIDVLLNDTIPDALDTIFVAQNPNHGTVVVNSDNTMTYTPSIDYCDDSSPDYFTYVACTAVGCDTSSVFITIPCEKLHIYTGFSPDGDNNNDKFVIKGIENYPEAKVCVYNRWGNLVMDKTGYKNDWEGTWNDGEKLPSGTYFYVIYMKDGDILSGYLQLMNR